MYVPRGQFELALAADSEVLYLAEELNAPDLACYPLIILAWVYWLTGQRHEVDRVLARLRTVVSPGIPAEGYYCCLSALMAQEQGDMDLARSLYEKAHAIGERTGELSVSILVRVGMSRLKRACGNASAARQWSNDAATLAARAEYLHFEGMALIERGRASWEMGDALVAETDWRAAIQVLAAIGAAFDLARALVPGSASAPAAARRVHSRLARSG